eukprot:scaffold1.g5535.t1
MPFLEPQLARLRPALLAGLAADPERAAARLVELRALLPRANVAAVLSQRPSLVLDGEWEAVPAGLARLLAYYTEEEAAAMVSVEPCLLLDDVRVVLRELTRWFKARSSKEKTYLGVVGAVLLLLLLWFVVDDHDTLFVLSESVHFLGIGLLAYKLLKKRNCGAGAPGSPAGAGKAGS